MSVSTEDKSSLLSNFETNDGIKKNVQISSLYDEIVSCMIGLGHPTNMKSLFPQLEPFSHRSLDLEI